MINQQKGFGKLIWFIIIAAVAFAYWRLGFDWESLKSFLLNLGQALKTAWQDYFGPGFGFLIDFLIGQLKLIIKLILTSKN